MGVWLKIKQGGYAGFGPGVYLPGFHFGAGFWATANIAHVFWCFLRASPQNQPTGVPVVLPEYPTEVWVSFWVGHFGGRLPLVEFLIYRGIRRVRFYKPGCPSLGAKWPVKKKQNLGGMCDVSVKILPDPVWRGAKGYPPSASMGRREFLGGKWCKPGSPDSVATVRVYDPFKELALGKS